jgi:choline dehydrogenase-like flavoprotein
MTYGPHRLSEPTTMECDVLVVGSGAGGAIVADALTAAERDVVMLEEGPFLDHDRVPSSLTESLSQMWRCGGLTVSMGSPPIPYVEGRCVGGGTEINTAIMQRTSDDLLNEWARRYHIAEFGGAALKPYYDATAAAINASLTEPPLGEASNILREGAEALGWRFKRLDRAQRFCVGTNLCAAGCPTGGKQSMTATAIPLALSRGARLIAECRVDKLVVRRNRISEVHASARDHEGNRHHVAIRPHSVFLCAGAIHTPALLRRSGVRRNIGNTLRMHPTMKVVAQFDRRVDAHMSRVPLYAITEFEPDQRLGGSLFQPGFFALSLAEDWHQREWMLPQWRTCGIYYAMARGYGVGAVRAIPGCREPLVRYVMTEEDWRNIGMGIGHLAQALIAAGAVHVYPGISGHPGWDHPSQCDEFIQGSLPRQHANLMSIHLFSSCPPGADRNRCATDSFGKVYDIDNLIIADGSQIPEAPGVNPQLTIMAMASRNSAAFLAGAA